MTYSLDTYADRIAELRHRLPAIELPTRYIITPPLTPTRAASATAPVIASPFKSRFISQTSLVDSHVCREPAVAPKHSNCCAQRCKNTSVLVLNQDMSIKQYIS